MPDLKPEIDSSVFRLLRNQPQQHTHCTPCGRKCPDSPQSRSSCSPNRVGALRSRGRRISIAIVAAASPNRLTPISTLRRPNLVPHRDHQDRGPRPRGSQRRLSPPRAASAGPRHRAALQRPGHGAHRPAARLGLSRRHRHDDRAGPATITTTVPGATRPSSIASSRSTPSRRRRIEARKKGHQITEQSLADGSIKLTIRVGGGS